MTDAVLVWNGRVAEPLSTRLRSLPRRDDVPLETSERRRSFGSVADLHDGARPEYPDEPFDDLVSLARLVPGTGCS